MTTTHDIDFGTLSWVKKELDETLNQARQALEAHVAGPDDATQLTACAAHLHQVHGTLQMVELYGAALLAEEMEQIVAALGDGAAANPDDASEVLMRAILQLPDYLERLLVGHRDIPLVLLPLLNDLRAARGKPLLSDNVLFSPDVSAPLPMAPQGDVDTARALARKLRHRFQTGLLDWYRDRDARAGLNRLAEVLAQLEQQAASEAALRLWWVAGGVVEALRDEALTSSVTVKLLLGQIDRQIKSQIDAGETALTESGSVELLKSLLYYVAHARPVGARIPAIQQTFRLDELLPRDDEIAAARESLAGRNTALMETVAAAIKEDLTRIKESLDIFVRNDQRQTSDLQPLGAALHQVADTLGMLGMGEPRRRVKEQAAIIEAIATANAPADDNRLMAMAGVLVYVESCLDNLGAGRSVQRDRSAFGGTDDAGSDYRQALNAVLHEAIADIGAIKDAVVAFMHGNWDHGLLADTPRLFNQIKGGMQMLAMHDAAALLDAVQRYMNLHLLAQRIVPEPEVLDDLADAITSIEYYLEGAAQDRINRQSVLEMARRSMARLGYAVAESRPPEPLAVVEAAVSAPGETRDTFGAVEAVDSTSGAAEAAPEHAAPVATARVTAAPAAAPTENLDQEILDIFIEEAGEELSSIRTQLPLWRDNPDDSEALTTLRRSFHTLKGSGRLVGAMLIGEFAWAFESLLNRVIDHTISATAATFTLLDHAAAVLPQLIAQLTGGVTPPVDVQTLIHQAQALSRGEPVEIAAVPPAAADVPADVARVDLASIEIAAVASEPEEIDVQAVAADAADEALMDPVLYDIFSKESAGHIEDIQRFIEACREQREGCCPTESLVRALHTLHGSAHMAGSNDIADLAAALEKYCKALMNHRALIPAEGLEVLNDAATAVNALLAVLNIADAPRADTAQLHARIAALYAGLDAHAAEPVDVPAEPEQHIESAVEAPVPVVAASTAVPAAVVVAPVDEVDQELLDVFLEEGEEVLAHGEDLLQQWQNDQQNLKLVEALQRELHTLKGGARLAGLTAMGNLSHAVESALAAVCENRLGVTGRLFDVLHMTQDRLLGMLEMARAHAPLDHATDLLQEIEELLETQTAPAADAVAADSDDVAAPDDDAHLLPREPDVVSLREDRRAAPRLAHEQVRVRAELLDNLVNYAGEVSIYRSRMEQQTAAFRFNLSELSQTVARLRDQLRKMEIETEAQILFRYEEAGGDYAEFDPLELDRFSHLQQLSRSLVESVGDVTSIQALFDNLTRESETLLLQQSRVVTELQEGLMRTRMVPFASLAPRLRRIVRQTCQELDKRAELVLQGAEGEMDRTVIDRVLAPLEHMLRNAVSHGIEAPNARRGAGKHEVGKVVVSMAREGSEVVLKVVDDGAGMDLAAIRSKAMERGLLQAGDELSDNDVMQFILESGFSTATEITQISGRGVGMDVVNSEIKQLGGSLHIDSRHGAGTTFTVRLPFTLAISQALLVQIGEENYAIPLGSIEGIVRLTGAELERLYADPKGHYKYAGHSYLVRHLGALFNMTQPPASAAARKLPVLLVRSGDQRVALQVEGLLGSREIVVKSVGPQISTVRGVSGATILGDGRVVLILDMAALVRMAAAAQMRALRKAPELATKPARTGLTVMVVDDSITVRKVTSRLLERNNMTVITAKDGVDAVAMLQEQLPDIMLLDIEMPRMDGYELATHVRNEARLHHIPMIMITSRTGEKHRQRAMTIGVNTYLGKPYQESELLEEIYRLTGEKIGHA